MAEKHDRYKEGKDFVWVDKGGYKTRKFLTAAEKKAASAPKPAPAKAKPAVKAAPVKRKETPAKPLVTPKVETMKGIAPSGGRGNGRVEMVARRTEGALKKAAEASAPKPKTVKTTTPAKPTTSTKVSYEVWDKMSRAERKAKGYPLSVTGFQNWRQ